MRYFLGLWFLIAGLGAYAIHELAGRGDVVATRDLPTGKVLAPGDLKVADQPLDQFIGRYLLRDVHKDEAIDVYAAGQVPAFTPNALMIALPVAADRVRAMRLGLSSVVALCKGDAATASNLRLAALQCTPSDKNQCTALVRLPAAEVKKITDASIASGPPLRLDTDPKCGKAGP